MQIFEVTFWYHPSSYLFLCFSPPLTSSSCLERLLSDRALFLSFCTRWWCNLITSGQVRWLPVLPAPLEIPQGTSPTLKPLLRSVSFTSCLAFSHMTLLFLKLTLILSVTNLVRVTKDFPGGSAVKTTHFQKKPKQNYTLPMQGAWVWTLVGELISTNCMMWPPRKRKTSD